MMYLHARTNRQGSEVKTPLDVSEKEWVEMSAEDQDSLVQEALGDLIESWVEEGLQQLPNNLKYLKKVKIFSLFSSKI